MRPQLDALAGLLPDPLTVVDVGCRWGPQSIWMELPNVDVIGFDPDAEECRRLAAEAGDRARYVPLALGARPGRATLHLTADPACASLYPPDPDLVTARPSLRVTAPAGETTVAVETLDAWAAVNDVDRIDYLKIDTQGSELDVLEGAAGLLSSVRIVEAEVEFNPIYRGQPLFGDVDALLRGHDFVLWRLAELAHYDLPEGLSRFERDEVHYFDVDRPATAQGSGGQLYWANAFWVRRDMAFPPGPCEWGEGLRDVVAAGAHGYRDLALQAAGRVHDAPPEVAALLAELATGQAASQSR